MGTKKKGGVNEVNVFPSEKDKHASIAKAVNSYRPPGYKYASGYSGSK